MRDGSGLGLPAPRNVVNSDSILQDLGANDVIGSQGQDGLCTVEIRVPSCDQKERSIQTRRIGGVNRPLTPRGQKESHSHPHLELTHAHARPPAESVRIRLPALWPTSLITGPLSRPKASSKSGGEEVRIDQCT